MTFWFWLTEGGRWRTLGRRRYGFQSRVYYRTRVGRFAFHVLGSATCPFVSNDRAAWLDYVRENKLSKAAFNAAWSSYRKVAA